MNENTRVTDRAYSRHATETRISNLELLESKYHAKVVH